MRMLVAVVRTSEYSIGAPPSVQRIADLVQRTERQTIDGRPVLSMSALTLMRGLITPG